MISSIQQPLKVNSTLSTLLTELGEACEVDNALKQLAEIEEENQ